MKRLLILPFVLSYSLLLAGCGTDGLYTLTIITDGQHKLSQNIPGDLLILGGEVSLSKDASVFGNVHLLLGKLVIDGRIEEDVSFLNGELRLGPSAVIRGDLNLGGGLFQRSPTSVIEGKINAGAGIPLPSAPEREAFYKWSFWFRAIFNGVLSGLIAAVLARYFPSVIGHITEAMTRHSLASGAMGVLTGIVGISLLVTMVYTILLIPVSILILCLLAISVFLGWVGLGVELGRLLARALKRSWKPSMMTFLGMLIFMLGLQLFTSIPILGGLLGLALASIGLGAVSLTRFGLRRFIPVTDGGLSE